MATCLRLETQATTTRRAEILQWRASIGTRTDAELLGVSATPSSDELRASFVSLARRFHPDSLAPEEGNLHAEMQAIFVRITQAYQNLKRAARPALEREPAAPPERRVPVSVRAPVRVPVRVPAPPAPRAVSSEPDLAERRVRVEQALALAEGMIARRQVDEAVSVLHEVLTQADERRGHRIRLLLARAYAAERRYRRYGVALLRELIEADPADAEALALLGGLYQSEGLLARAEPLFARALVADPGLVEAREALRAVRSAKEARRLPVEEQGRKRLGGLIARLLPRAR
jgi:tetratricopeptide (TPR) repeat protein